MIAKIAWKNIWFKPLNTFLSVVLLTASIAIITVLILLQKQFENQFSSNIKDVDVVIGAQGSPLQLILSSVYQMDAPTGNINYGEAQTWMKHPFVKSAIPLAFGDNYRGFKILGTTEDYINKYEAKLQSGTIFKENFEVVIGSTVASKMNLKIGDTFFSAHGDAAEGEVHEDFPYKVVGILSATGMVIDNLILSNVPSVWAVHSHEGHNHENDDHDHAHDHDSHNHDSHNHESHDHGDHDHDHAHDHDHDHAEHENHIDEANQEITAVLIKFKNKMGFITWPRLIAQNTKMQAASPAIEVNRLFSLFGIGIQALQYLAYGIMFISGLSIFIALYNTLKDRKYEFALLRINGAKRSQLLGLVLFESLLLCVVGFVFGTIVGRAALYLISSATHEEYKMSFDPLAIDVQKEGILFLITISVGIIAALIPAIKAYKLNISKTLSNA